MSTLIQDSIADGSLVLWHDYRSGSFRDWSENDNEGAPTGVVWQNGRLKFDGAGYVLVADSAELRVTSGTMFALLDFDRVTNEDRIISKRDAGGNAYELYIFSDTRIIMVTASGTSQADGAYQGAKALSVGFVTTEIPDFYMNGVFVSAGNNALTVTADDAPLYVGNRYTVNRVLTDPLKSVLLFNRKITADEHAQVYSELMETGGPS